MPSTDNKPSIKAVDCPTCGNRVPWSEESPHRPFCSEHCQLLDFGDWASERHAIPGKSATHPDGDIEGNEGSE